MDKKAPRKKTLDELIRLLAKSKPKDPLEKRAKEMFFRPFMFDRRYDL